MKNKIIAHLSIILILMGVFCNVCTSYNRISVYDRTVYAAADNWSACDSSDLATAFRYYCKSRNLALEGSAADALTSFTTTTFNNICSTLGIDPTTLSAELKKTTEGNLGLRFLFSNTGITAYNRIFAEFLQNNDLDVGEQIDNKQIWSGKSFTDDNGNSALVFEVEKKGTFDIPIKSYGSPYVYTNSELVSMAKNNTLPHSVNFNIGNEVYTMKLYGSLNENNRGNLFWHNNTSQNTYWSIYRFPTSNNYTSPTQLGYSAIIFDRLTSKLYLGSYIKETNGTFECAYPSLEIENGNTENQTVNVTTNNNTINNNTYNNNYTIIYNGGDTYYTDDDDEPLPTTPPSGGGGGGGGDNPTNPDIPPVDPTPTPPPTIPDWDIELPEMPTGNDWLLYGLEKKFPWDIPFNLMYMLSLFAADPETPHFEGTLDLKVVQWDYDIDLAPFDDIARNVRNFEFIGFLLGLMLLTRKLIWG